MFFFLTWHGQGRVSAIHSTMEQENLLCLSDQLTTGASVSSIRPYTLLTGHWYWSQVTCDDPNLFTGIAMETITFSQVLIGLEREWCHKSGSSQWQGLILSWKMWLVEKNARGPTETMKCEVWTSERRPSGHRDPTSITLTLENKVNPSYTFYWRRYV